MADREVTNPAPVSTPTCLAPCQAPHLQLPLAYCMPHHAMQTRQAAPASLPPCSPQRAGCEELGDHVDAALLRILPTLEALHTGAGARRARRQRRGAMGGRQRPNRWLRLA